MGGFESRHGLSEPSGAGPSQSAAGDDPIDLQIDDDGFVCVIAPDGYSGFVDEDWALDQLLARFVEQMNQGNLFIAYPGPDHAGADLAFEQAPSPESAIRKVAGIVHVGDAGLWLTDYTELTMAAQFEDAPPLASYSRRLPIAPGTYRVTLRERPLDGSHFLLTVAPADAETVVEHRSVPWFE